MVSTHMAIINSSVHCPYWYDSVTSTGGRQRQFVKCMISTVKTEVSSFTKNLYQRSVLLVETCRPFLYTLSAGLVSLKNYSIRVVVCSTVIVKETSKGLGLGLAAGTATSFLLLLSPAIVVVAPTIQTTASVVGGLGGFLYGVEIAQGKWRERVTKESCQR